jgi:hypothetical protein
MAYDTHLADRIRSILKRECEFTEVKMFGGIAFMVNDRMCCGVVKDDLVLRLTPELTVESLRLPHTRIMDFTGRPMKSMIYVSPGGTDLDEDLETRVHSAVAVARTEAPRARPKKRVTASAPES